MVLPFKPINNNMICSDLDILADTIHIQNPGTTNKMNKIMHIKPDKQRQTVDSSVKSLYNVGCVNAAVA